jgi:tripartite-type tricarboxylate transporter receptor subunit TctC
LPARSEAGADQPEHEETILPFLFSRRALGAASLAVGLTGTHRPAAAADYPTRPIRLVVPYVPGGVTDNMARLLAVKLSARLGQQVVIENRAGAGGMIGTENVIRSPADGYSLLLATVTLTVYPSFNKNFTYDIHRDLAPISILSSAPYVILVGPRSPYRTLADLIRDVHANPGRLNFGSPGVGTSTHLAFEAFLSAADAKMVHVPYGGSAAVQTALLSDDVQVMFDTYTGVAGPVETGQLRALAITAKERAAFNSSIPTMTEAGLPGFTADTWFGILAPGGTPAAVTERLQQEIATVLKDPQVAESYAKQGAVVGNTPAQFAEVLVADRQRWAKVIADARIERQ